MTPPTCWLPPLLGHGAGSMITLRTVTLAKVALGTQRCGGSRIDAAAVDSAQRAPLSRQLDCFLYGLPAMLSRAFGVVLALGPQSITLLRLRCFHHRHRQCVRHQVRPVPGSPTVVRGRHGVPPECGSPDHLRSSNSGSPLLSSQAGAVLCEVPRIQAGGAAEAQWHGKQWHGRQWHGRQWLWTQVPRRS